MNTCINNQSVEGIFGRFWVRASEIYIAFQAEEWRSYDGLFALSRPSAASGPAACGPSSTGPPQPRPMEYRLFGADGLLLIKLMSDIVLMDAEATGREGVSTQPIACVQSVRRSHKPTAQFSLSHTPNSHPVLLSSPLQQTDLFQLQF